MTTIITIFVAIALLVALGKIFSKSSSGLSGSGGTSADSSEPASSPEKSKKNSPAVKKERKMFSNKAIKGESLFHAPPEPPLFTGRKETQQLILAQTTHRPILLGVSGYPGVGKTCLAITLINKFASQFPGNCLFIDMQGEHPDPPSAEDIMRRVILRFHPSQILPADNKKLAKLYRVALKPHKGILILDNAADTKQIKPLAPPSSWLLIVTSVKPISIPSMVAIVLEPMDNLEAQTLLTRWAAGINPAITEITQICKGIPLALEIIGKLFAINSTMAPDYFAKKLKEVRESFGADDKGNFSDGTRAAISLSYNMLPDKAAAVLKKLSVFPGSFTASAVTFICEDTKNLSLTGLEKFGLVQYNINTDRYFLHEQVKKFIKPLLKPGDRAMAERRLATEFMNVLESVHDQVEKGANEAIKGFRLLDLEMENIKAGMEWGRKHSANNKDAAQICNTYIENGVTMICQRLSPSESIQWLEAALTAARQLQDKKAEGQHLLNLGCQYVVLNKFQEATNALQSALSFCKKEGDVEGQRTALDKLAQIYIRNNDYPSAIKFLEGALELAQTNDDKEEEFKLLAQLTISCTQNKEYNKAIDVGDQAMDLVDENEDMPLLINLLYNMGKVHLEKGNAEKALEKFEKGLAFSLKSSYTPLQGKLYLSLGETIFQTGDIPGALKCLKKGLDTVSNAKDLSSKGPIMILLAEIHMQNQGEDQAIHYFEDVINLSKKSKDALLEGQAEWKWSLALGKKGSAEEAITRAQKALKIFEKLNNPEVADIKAQIDKWFGE